MKSVQVHNKSARIKHVQVGNGRTVSIAPTEAPTSINFETDEDARRFTDALKSPAIQKWVDAGELEVGGAKNTDSAAPSAFTAPPMSKAAEEPKHEEPRTRGRRE